MFRLDIQTYCRLFLISDNSIKSRFLCGVFRVVFSCLFLLFFSEKVFAATLTLDDFVNTTKNTSTDLSDSDSVLFNGSGSDMTLNVDASRSFISSVTATNDGAGNVHFNSIGNTYTLDVDGDYGAFSNKLRETIFKTGIGTDSTLSVAGQSVYILNGISTEDDGIYDTRVGGLKRYTCAVDGEGCCIVVKVTLTKPAV